MGGVPPGAHAMTVTRIASAELVLAYDAAAELRTSITALWSQATPA